MSEFEKNTHLVCELPKLIDSMTFAITVARLTKPFELKGDTEAALLATALRGKTLTPQAIKMRIQRGIYKKDLHFRLSGGKMRLWNREALIATEIKFMEDEGYEVV